MFGKDKATAGWVSVNTIEVSISGHQMDVSRLVPGIYILKNGEQTDRFGKE